jgi:hypothetical protein
MLPEFTLPQSNFAGASRREVSDVGEHGALRG